MKFCDRRPPQLVVAVGHNIFEVTGIPIRDLFIEVTDGYVQCEQCSKLFLWVIIQISLTNNSCFPLLSHKLCEMPKRCKIYLAFL